MAATAGARAAYRPATRASATSGSTRRREAELPRRACARQPRRPVRDDGGLRNGPRSAPGVPRQPAIRLDRPGPPGCLELAPDRVQLARVLEPGPSARAPRRARRWSSHSVRPPRSGGRSPGPSSRPRSARRRAGHGRSAGRSRSSSAPDSSWPRYADKRRGCARRRRAGSHSRRGWAKTTGVEVGAGQIVRRGECQTLLQHRGRGAPDEVHAMECGDERLGMLGQPEVVVGEVEDKASPCVALDHPVAVHLAVAGALLELEEAHAFVLALEAAATSAACAGIPSPTIKNSRSATVWRRALRTAGTSVGPWSCVGTTTETSGVPPRWWPIGTWQTSGRHATAPPREAIRSPRHRAAR